MNRFSRAALLAAATIGFAAASPALAQAQPKPKDAKDFKLTKEVRALLAEAQPLIAAGDNAGALTKLNAALPLAKTADDRFLIGNLMVDAGSKSNDIAVQRRGVDLLIGSGSLPPADLGKFNFYAGQFAYTAGEYDKALAYFATAKAAGYAEPKLPILIADSNFKAKKTSEGLASLRQAVDAETAAGRKPNEDWIKLGLSEAYKAKQNDQVTWWAQTYLKSYPTQKNWRTLLVVYRDANQLDGQTLLDLMRLMRATKSLAGERDFFEYADMANERGLPGEAKAVIDEGRASGALGTDTANIKELYSLATTRSKGDQASLAAAAKTAATAKDGKSAMNTADAYLSYKEYAKAAELYTVALTKGGVDANMVNTRLGIALAMSGQKPAAKEAFAKVTGPRQGVADYWEMYLDQPVA